MCASCGSVCVGHDGWMDVQKCWNRERGSNGRMHRNDGAQESTYEENHVCGQWPAERMFSFRRFVQEYIFTFRL